MAQTGAGGLSFAQVDVDDEEKASPNMYLSQLAVVLAHMPEQDVDTVENYLAQLESVDAESHEIVLAQIGVEEDDNLGKLATMLAQLDDSELAQLTDILEDSSNELAEIDSESESENESESESEGESGSESESEDDVFAQIDSEVDDDEMFNEVAEFLAQINEEDM